MEELYNWKEDRIYFKVSNLTFDLQLRKPYTLIDGMSGSGKTLLVTSILDKKKEEKQSYREYNVSNIVVIDNNTEHIKNILNSTKKKLIIIDKADSIITDDINDIIYANKNNNRYLIMIRKPITLPVSPNHIAELVNSNNVFKLTYEFNQEGWE